MRASQLSAPPRTKICAAILTGFALFGSLVGGVAAQQVPAVPQAAPLVNFDVPAGPLVDTLDTIAKQSGRAVEFDRAALVGRQAPLVRGSMTARQAVAAALAGSGLAPAEDGPVLRVTSVLQRVEVYAKRDQAEKSFKADRSDTATRSGTDLLDVPAGVTVITSKVLETQQATSLRDTLRNVSGIGFTESTQGPPQFSVRGFAQSSLTTNGVTDRNATSTNVFGVERLEILKGPQAILAGGDSLGGGVNVVTKRPSADPVRDITLQYGSQQDATAAFDISNALGDDRRLSVRFIGATSRAGETDQGYNGRKDDSFMPQGRWKDATTDLIVGLSYGRQHQPMPEYTFARRDGVILPTPHMALAHEDDGFDAMQKRVFYQLEQKVTPSISFISRVQDTHDNLLLHTYGPGGLRYNAGAPPNDTNGTSRLFPSLTKTEQRQISGDHYFRLQFETGAFDHKLSAGFGHSLFRYQQVGKVGGATITATLYPTAVPVTLSEVEAVNVNTDSVTDVIQRQKGLFVQDLISYGDWSVLLNFRRTLYTLYSKTNFVTAKFIFEQPEVTIGSSTPGVGIVYRLTPSMSLYGSYSEGFVPQTAAACGGGIVPPIETRNKEVGAKFLLLDDKLALTTAVFDVQQSNQLIFDPVNRCQNVRPSTRTRGLEVDMQGELAKGWSAIFNYTYTSIKDVKDPARLYPALARNKASLWTTYQLPFETLKGLGVGMGVAMSSSMDGTIDPLFPFRIPSQTQVDASVFYDQPTWGLTLGVKNLADRRLYGVSTSNSYVPVRPGRSFMLTLKKSFN